VRGVLFLVGASGVGKTTVAELLAGRSPWAGHTYHFDSIGVPSSDEMERRFGAGESWQKWATRRWVESLASRDGTIQLLEGQTRPSFILPATSRYPALDARIILLDCSSDVRQQRLTDLRGRPELANSQMDHWATYLRGQADALALPVIDTSEAAPEAIASAVEETLGPEWLSRSAL